MYVVGLIIIAAMGAGLIVQDRKIQKLKAQKRICHAKYKQVQLIMAQHDRASLAELEKLRKSYKIASHQSSRECQLKHAFRRNCEAMKKTLDDRDDEIESLRSALASANGTIRELTGMPGPEDGESVLLQGEEAAAFMEAATASSGREP